MPGKVKYHQLSEKEKKEYLGDFYSIVASLKNRDEVKSFFKDLLTLSEIVMISRRIQIAKMLLRGVTHEIIREKLRVGFNNIAQVENWLHNGFGGYRSALKNFKDRGGKEERRITEEYPFSFSRLRRKYPAHFLLVNMILDREKNKK